MRPGDSRPHENYTPDDFVGRRWVLEAVDQWLTSIEPSRWFLLTGEPGSGKTWIAQHLRQISRTRPIHDDADPLRAGFLSASHFCRAQDSRSLSPIEFSCGLSLQLAKTFPDFAMALMAEAGNGRTEIRIDQRAGNVFGQQIGMIIESLTIGSDSAFEAFGRVILRPLDRVCQRSPEHPITILVDALDEALQWDQAITILDLIARTEGLPQNVRFIVTSRRHQAVQQKLRHGSERGGLT